MKILDVELGDDVSDRRNAVRNFLGSEVIILDKGFGKRMGMVLETNFDNYRLKIPSNRFFALFFNYDFTGDYTNLIRMQVVNPREGDGRRAREGYRAVTQSTIDETTKWAKRGYRA